MVPQTDLVPTLALLLGVPIPYSNIGQALLPLFPRDTGSPAAPPRLGQAEALWINTKQVRSSRPKRGSQESRLKECANSQASTEVFSNFIAFI